MLAVLAGPLPITARGAAVASALLSDGTGPLHNRHSGLDLGTAIREATRLMTARPAGVAEDLAATATAGGIR